MQIAQCYIHLTRSIDKIKKENKLLWGTQKNTGDVEKWALKKEELEKKIKKSNFLSQF